MKGRWPRLPLGQGAMFVGLAAMVLAMAVPACGGGGGGGGPKKRAPSLGAPTGPGAVSGPRPTFTTVLEAGDALDFDVTATDGNANDTIVLTAAVTGGSLTEAQAGFTTFPAMATGLSPQTLSFAGAAAAEGDIEITFLVDDGTGRTDGFTLSVTIRSNALAWGDNTNGQLGDGTMMGRVSPVQVVDPPDPTGLLRGVTAVAARRSQTLALLGDGTVRGFGENSNGQLGDGTSSPRSEPVQVLDPSDPSGFLTGVTAIASGSSHSVALRMDGTVRTWGGNNNGQLGDGTMTPSGEPVQVVDAADPTGFLTGITAITAGRSHTVALKGDGTVWTWGRNEAGQLGNGMGGAGMLSAVPVQVVDPSDPTGFLTGVAGVAAGQFHTMARLGDGTVRTWGDNGDGQLGDGTQVDSFTPVQVVDPSDPSGFLTGAAEVAARSVQSFARLGDGTLRAWGSNAHGKLGDGTTTRSFLPVQVVDPSAPSGFLGGVVAVAAGADHTLALLDDGTLRAWGDNVSGQLGEGGTQAESWSPVPVIDPSSPTGFLREVEGMAAGEFHSVAFR